MHQAPRQHQSIAEQEEADVTHLLVDPDGVKGQHQSHKLLSERFNIQILDLSRSDFRYLTE